MSLVMVRVRTKSIFATSNIANIESLPLCLRYSLLSICLIVGFFFFSQCKIIALAMNVILPTKPECSCAKHCSKISPIGHTFKPPNPNFRE